MSNSQWMSVPQFARMIGVSPDTAHRIIEQGEIRHTLIGQRKRVARSYAREYLNRHSFGGAIGDPPLPAGAAALLR